MPLIFTVTVDVITDYAREDLANYISYADSLFTISDRTENLREKFLKWKEAFDSKGMKVNFKMTKVW